MQKGIHPLQMAKARACIGLVATYKRSNDRATAEPFARATAEAVATATADSQT